MFSGFNGIGFENGGGGGGAKTVVIRLQEA